MRYSAYFTAQLLREKTWLVSGIIRNQGHMCLERCLDKHSNTFEFFIAPDFEQDFIKLADFFVSKGYFLSYQKQPSRVSA